MCNDTCRGCSMASSHWLEQHYLLKFSIVICEMSYDQIYCYKDWHMIIAFSCKVITGSSYRLENNCAITLTNSNLFSLFHFLYRTQSRPRVKF
jgi:hypothetical protein